MRQRGVKNREEIVESCKEYIAPDPAGQKGRWAEAFPKKQPIYLEIGSGKGKFACEMALRHPERNFLAAEGAKNVNVRILQKAKEYQLSNLLVIMDYVDDAEGFFAEGELEGIYLNFSDPWPKARNEKRRLTSGARLAKYKKICRPGSFLQFKTDNEDLFEWSLEEIRRSGLLMCRVTRDLQHSPYASSNVKTEYEEKFASRGKNINCVLVRLSPRREE